MRSKSRFTTLVLLETRESYLQIRVKSLCTLRGHCRQGSRRRIAFPKARDYAAMAQLQQVLGVHERDEAQVAQQHSY
jgi:hypothetical protein